MTEQTSRVPSVFMDLSKVPIEMAARIGGSGPVHRRRPAREELFGHRASGISW